jgi:hypothetical protein
MPRDRVVLTREDSDANDRADFNRLYRRGFTYIGVGALFDVAGAVLIFLEQWAAGIAVCVVGILIGLLAAREFARAGRAAESRRA